MKGEKPLTSEELRALLVKIRIINLLCLKGVIDGRERVRKHQELVPDIGKMEGLPKGKGKETYYCTRKDR